jgi:hemerythrin-like metal-binding protein
MALITWTKDLSVGIPSIDVQHKKLVELINELHDAMKAGSSKQIISTVLNNLVLYTKTHFSNEEKCMTDACFSGLKDHKCKHDELTQKVLEFQNNYNGGRAVMSIDVLNFLTDWLKNHIMKKDKEYSAHLISNGVH